jgi:serine/threonine-protein kinase
MVHRDIKPQNIIVGEAGQVKITDFGIAKSKMSTALTETGVTFGTADYISPEQARGQAATPQSDVYSLGITLYEMLTGRLPFTGDSSVAVAMQHVGEEPPPPRMYNPRIPPQLEAIVLRALNKDPRDRPASAGELARLIETYRDAGDQVTVVRPGPVRPAPQPQPRASTAPQPPRQVLPPPRSPVVAQPPPDSRGVGFGSFILGLLLLGGVLGLVYLFIIGAFDGLLSLASGGPTRPPAATATPEPGTAVAALLPVPDVLGKTEAEARAALQGLGVFVAPPRNSDTITAGLVLEQFPPPNVPVEQSPATTITLTLSLGPELVDVPDVQRTRASDARNLLGAAGFQVDVREEASTVSEGFVVRQEPVGVKLPRGQTVTIYVSIGDRVLVPEITGMNEADARARIAAAGLFVSFIDVQGCDKLGSLCDRFGPGTIVSSDPRPGTRVPRGTGVTLGQRAP